MNWKKHQTKEEGRHGLIYRIARGVTVRKTERGIWTIYLENNYKRKNISIGSTNEDLEKAVEMAEAIAKKFQDEEHCRILGDERTERTNFKDYSMSWLENNAPRWTKHTYGRYESILRLHIWPRFSDAILEEITRLEIKRFLLDILKKRSPASVELVKDVFSGIFEDAVEEGLIPSNPTDRILKRILPPKNRRNLKSAEPFTKDELDKFIQTAEKMSAVPWAEELILKVMAYTGFRLGEALAMKADNLDVQSCAYYITESYKLHTFDPPKKGKKRLVDLPKFLVEELHQYILHLKKKGLQEGKGGEVNLLFIDPEENDCPYSQRKIQRLVKRVCHTAGLRIRHPHDLRHTYATILLMSHKSPAYVQKQLGHHSIQITVDIYGHWVPGEGRENLDEAFLVKENPKEITPRSGSNRTQNAYTLER